MEKNIIKSSGNALAFKHLVLENSFLENIKDILFEELKTSEYLLHNKSTSLGKIIFSLRSKAFDIKKWLPCKYYDNLCVACELKKETMNHFF